MGGCQNQNLVNQVDDSMYETHAAYFNRRVNQDGQMVLCCYLEMKISSLSTSIYNEKLTVSKITMNFRIALQRL